MVGSTGYMNDQKHFKKAKIYKYIHWVSIQFTEEWADDTIQVREGRLKLQSK